MSKFSARRMTAVVGGMLALPSLVLAGAPTMPAITLPIDGASVVTAVIAIGLTVLLLWAGPKIGFKLAKALIRVLGRVVGG